MMASPEAATNPQELAGCEYDVWCVGVMLLQVLLGSELVRTVLMSLACISMHQRDSGRLVAQLHSYCSSATEWQQPGAAALGAVLFSCMAVGQEQRSSSDQLLLLPCFSAPPTWGELALLRCHAPAGRDCSGRAAARSGCQADSWAAAAAWAADSDD
jgi:hypothetical protein